MNTLSVIIITKNEAENIQRCLESVAFADEIIVLDSGSTDDTVKIAKNFTPHVYVSEWHGYGRQKNLALEKATKKWILSLDADEYISDELRQEIQQLLKQEPSCNAYYILRKTSYCNRVMHHGDGKNDYELRIFKRGLGKFKDVPVHECLVIQGEKDYLKNSFYHYSFPNLEKVLDKMNRYSSLSAEYKYGSGKKGSLTKAIFHGVWRFIRGYFLKLGFLDGKRGFMLAFSNAEGSYYRYLKIMLLEEKN